MTITTRLWGSKRKKVTYVYARSRLKAESLRLIVRNPHHFRVNRMIRVGLRANIGFHFMDLLPWHLNFRVIKRYFRACFMLTFTSAPILFHLLRKAINGFTFRLYFIRVINNLNRFRWRLLIRILLLGTNLFRFNFNYACFITTFSRVRRKSTCVRGSERANVIRRVLIIRFRAVCVIV